MTASPEQMPLGKIEQQQRDARFAMWLSLFVGVLMLFGKVAAYLFTGSSAIFSEAAESVVHMVAVAFAVFSLWLSFGVVAGLGLVMLTGWKPFDPLVAFAVAANILWSGGRLMWHSIKGLLDYSDPKIGHQIRNRLDVICEDLGLQYHGVRFRTTGHEFWPDIRHAIFSKKSNKTFANP